MKTLNYLTQYKTWPETGKHILAQFDETSVTVYQAYRHSIATYALEHQSFGGEFSYSRMSWIKPNFLWMMYRSGWAKKEGQEYILAIKLRRLFFDELLKNTVASTFDPNQYESRDAWKLALENSEVRLQWDPDHDPFGHPIARRAVQLGLRGETLHRYGNQEILSIEDVTPFVLEQHRCLTPDAASLVIPEEKIYYPSDTAIARMVGIEDIAAIHPPTQ